MTQLSSTAHVAETCQVGLTEMSSHLIPVAKEQKSMPLCKAAIQVRLMLQISQKICERIPDGFTVDIASQWCTMHNTTAIKNVQGCTGLYNTGSSLHAYAACCSISDVTALQPRAYAYAAASAIHWAIQHQGTTVGQAATHQCSCGMRQHVYLLISLTCISRSFCLYCQPHTGLQTSIAEVAVGLLPQRQGKGESVGVPLPGKSLQGCTTIWVQIQPQQAGHFVKGLSCTTSQINFMLHSICHQLFRDLPVSNPNRRGVLWTFCQYKTQAFGCSYFCEICEVSHLPVHE